MTALSAVSRFVGAAPVLVLCLACTGRGGPIGTTPSVSSAAPTAAATAPAATPSAAATPLPTAAPTEATSGSSHPPTTELPTQPARHLVIDTDMAADDWIAILYLLE